MKIVEDAITAFCNAKKADATNTAAQKLLKLLQTKSKQIELNKDYNQRAFQCLKIAQQHLGSDGYDSLTIYSICEILLEQLQASTDAASTSQLLFARYSVVRKLVSAKLYSQAFNQAQAAIIQLSSESTISSSKGATKSTKPAKPTTEEINVAVGTTLTLAVCWSEGKDIDSASLEFVIDSCTKLEYWLSMLDSNEASKHTTSLLKYLCRGALHLLQAQRWLDVVSICRAIIDICPPLEALEAVNKLAPHLPQEHHMQLVLQCFRLEIIEKTLADLQCQLNGKHSGTSGKHSSSKASGGESGGQLLLAALQLGNLLRKTVAPMTSFTSDPSELIQLVGGAQTTQQVVQVLTSTASCMAVGCQLATKTGDSSLAAAFNKYSHSAAVAQVSSLRLWSALVRSKQIDKASDELLTAGINTGMEHLLGSGDSSSSSSSLGLCSNPVLPEDELKWLTSASYNVGVQLHTSGYHAVHAFLPALVASLSVVSSQHQTNGQLQQQAVDEVARKAAALVEAHLQAGNASDALTSLSLAINSMLACGIRSSSALLPLVMTHARTRLQLIIGSNTIDSTTAATRKKTKGGSRTSRKDTTKQQDKSSLPYLSQQIGEEGSHIVESLELQAWSMLAAEEQQTANIDDDADDTACHASNELSNLIDGLLKAHPVKTDAIAHCRLLVMAYELDLSVGSLTEAELLHKACQVLQTTKFDTSDKVETSFLLLKCQTLLALDAARVCVVLNVEDRRKCEEAQRAYRAQHPDRAAEGDCGPNAFSLEVDTESWEEVYESCEQAAVCCEELCKAVKTAISSREFEIGGEVYTAIVALLEDVAELTCMVGLQGYSELEAKLRKHMHSLCTQCDMCWKDFGLGVDMQQSMLDQIVLEGNADSDIEDVQKLENEAYEAANQPKRTPAVALQRVKLWTTISRHYELHGDLVAALHAATEAHRITSSCAAVSDTSASTGSSSTEGQADGGGSWLWPLAGCRLQSLLRLGALFEATGLAEEAVQTLFEGQCMASTFGCPLLAALLAVRAAHLNINQGQLGASKKQLSIALSSVASINTAKQQSSMPVYLSACLRSTEARISLENKLFDDCLEFCGKSMALCKDIASFSSKADDGSLYYSALLTAVAAETYLTKAECCLDQGEVSQAREAAMAGINLLEDNTTGSGVGYNARTLSIRLQLALFVVNVALQQADTSSNPSNTIPRIWGCSPSPPSNSDDSDVGDVCKSLENLQIDSRSQKPKSQKQAKTTNGTRTAAAEPLDWEQQLWWAYVNSRDLPHLHKLAAATLAKVCGRAGYVNLASVLLHCSMAPTLHVQYRLVQYTRAQQAQHGTKSSQDLPASSSVMCGALDEGLDSELLRLLASAIGSNTKHSGKSGGIVSRQDALTALNTQAETVLQGWLQNLPSNTAVCSVSVAGPATIIVSRLATASVQTDSTDSSSIIQIVPLVLELPASCLETALTSCSSSARHPIRALSLDDDGGGDSITGIDSVRGVQSVLNEMEAVLQESTTSMREMATETKEEQRAWWRARVALDNRLAALVKHLDTAWLGIWRCLLSGEPEDATIAAEHAAAAERVFAAVVDSLKATDGNSSSLIFKELVKCAVSARSSLSSSDFRRLLSATITATGNNPPSADVTAALEAIDAKQPPAAEVDILAKKGKRTARAVTFADPSFPGNQEEEEKDSPMKQPVTAVKSARRGGASSSSLQLFADPEASAVKRPVERDLCGAFGSLNVLDENGADNEGGSVAPGTVPRSTAMPPPSTARVKKHRSRIAMMHGGATPAAKSARKPLASSSRAMFMDDGAAGGGLSSMSSMAMPSSSMKPPATAPRQRKQPATPGAPQTMPVASRRTACTSVLDGSTNALGGDTGRRCGALVLVLDSELQALPWESMPCLKNQRVYRVPSLPCAVIARQSSEEAQALGSGPTTVDLHSTFYALNPSGDLTVTQETFQDWFANIKGWDGVAGMAPTAPELAAALRSRDLFVYFGHGGGEQYIPAGRLRALPRCAASLLMGCSSGRLKKLGHYQPTGVVLAYLLAGCPVVVANLWDVTDKDIDRFSQSLLTLWLSAVGEDARDVGHGVGLGRVACKLPHLIGAAPVCYGLPTQIVA